MTTIVANHLRLVEATERLGDLMERSLEQAERHHQERLLIESGKFREEAGPILSRAAQGCQDRREAERSL
jgi:hypothetical protein